ncbi:MAG: hypothetical protein O9296_01835 [Novosphingobium sp.]|nr:hypothetical protein [Novosphingobium sp.]
MNDNSTRMMAALRRLPQFSTSERMVLLAVAHFEEVGMAGIGNTALASLTNLHPVRSSNIRRRLVLGGFITRERSKTQRREPDTLTINWERFAEAIEQEERRSASEQRLAAEAALAKAAEAV